MKDRIFLSPAFSCCFLRYFVSQPDCSTVKVPVPRINIVRKRTKLGTDYMCKLFERKCFFVITSFEDLFSI